MPKTIEQTRIDGAARVITKHVPDNHWACMCGEEWHPLHLAKMLSAAGCLGVNPVPKYAPGGGFIAADHL